MRQEFHDIVQEVITERLAQVEKFGGGSEVTLNAVDDAENGLMEWTTYITAYTSKWFPGGFGPWPADTEQRFRTNMIKVAALAIAAAMWVDRRQT